MPLPGNEEVPPLLRPWINDGDLIRVLKRAKDPVILVTSPDSRKSRVRNYIYAVVGPCRYNPDPPSFVPIVPAASETLSIVIDPDAVERYFFPGARDPSLYSVLQVSRDANLGDLRLSWRLRSLECQDEVAGGKFLGERAFNLLADPRIRSAYDAITLGQSTTPVFPYDGFGEIVMEGLWLESAAAFTSTRIVAYRPRSAARVALFKLRQAEYGIDRIVCHNRKLRLVAWIDSTLLGGLNFDPTWNRWSRWLRSTIVVRGEFVPFDPAAAEPSGQTVRPSQVAIPSRMQVTVPETLSEDIRTAKARFQLLGENARLLEEIQRATDTEPISAKEIATCLAKLGATPDLRPQDVTWQPDYEDWYFDELMKRSTEWFIFQGQYLFVLGLVLVSEIPQRGHATYLFARPDSTEEFLRCYTMVNREDVRKNRGNIASRLGFIGRVRRGRDRRRWLSEVLKHAGCGVEDRVESK